MALERGGPYGKMTRKNQLRKREGRKRRKKEIQMLPLT